MLPRRSLVLTAALLAAVTACGGDEPEVAPTSSATALASPTASASPSPSPSPSPSGVPAPLTGVLVDPDVVDRPALAVKIENTAAARPQAGLEVADVVFEELVEGGITRFMAVFQSVVPEQVGPIRSARLVDAELLPALDGILLYSGGRPDVEAAISGTALRMTEGDPGVYRQSGRRAPSNLFADGPPLYAEAELRDPDLDAPATGFVFDEEPPPGACASCDGATIDIAFSSVTRAAFDYDEAAGLYRRRLGDAPQPTVSGDPVGAANVAVVAVTTFDGGCCDTAGSPYVVSRTTGEGRAVVLRDGQWYETTWVRPAADDPWTFTVDGVALPFAPGPTWIHLVPASRMPAEAG